MRQLLGVGLAVTLAGHGAAFADPSTPQINPLHRQREDAQRVTEQQRGLANEPAVAPAVAPPPPSGEISAGNNTAGAGKVMLGIAGVSGGIALTLPLFDDRNSEGGDGYGTLSAVFLVAGVITAVAGIALIAADRPVQVTPVVSPKAVGLAITGRL